MTQPSTLRRVAPPVLVGLAVFAFVFAGILAFWAPTHLVKTPLDESPRMVFAGTGKLYDVKQNKAVDHTFQITRTTVADSAKSDDDNVVLVQSQCFVINDAGDAPGCLKSDDPRFVDVKIDRGAFDRRSGEAVNDAKYGESYDGKPIKHTGLSYRWPFDAEKKTYSVFNTTTGKAFDARFVKTSKIGDFTVYKYTMDIPETAIELQPGVKGTYQGVISYFIEPETGSILWAQEDSVRMVPGLGVVLALSVHTVDNADSYSAASDAVDTISNVTVILPIVLAVLGVLAAVGAWLVARRRPSDDNTEQFGDNDQQYKLEYTPSPFRASSPAEETQQYGQFR